MIRLRVTAFMLLTAVVIASIALVDLAQAGVSNP
jgi:hypothetical protein